MTKQKISVRVRRVLALAYVGLLSVSCASGYNQPKQQQVSGLTEAELGYKVRELQIVLDGALRTGNPYEAARAAQGLAELASRYPQVCKIALEADAVATNMPTNRGKVSPSFGLVQQTCQGYR
jgi:hypothetical protein